MSIEMLADNVDPGTKLWRYIRLADLISLLETSKLTFTRADQFHDQLEGMKADQEYDLDNHMGLDDKPGSAQSVSKTEAFRNLQIQQDNKFRKRFGVSCWHSSDSENAAFWESNDRQIAIVSSLPAMEAALPTAVNLYAGSVYYGSQYQTPVVPLFVKRLDFVWEKEFRLVTGNTLFGDKLPKAKKHSFVTFDVNKLLSEVYINPKTPAWEAAAVKAMVSRYKLNAEVTISTLYDPLPELKKK